jgi:hypothetical protein
MKSYQPDEKKLNQNEKESFSPIPFMSPEDLSNGLVMITTIDNAHRLDFKYDPCNLEDLKKAQVILKQKIHTLFEIDTARPLYTLFEVFYLLANQGIEQKKLINKEKYEGGIVTSKIYFNSPKVFYQRPFEQVMIIPQNGVIPDPRASNVLYLQAGSDGQAKVYTDQDAVKILNESVVEQLLKDCKVEFSEETKLITDKELISAISSLCGFRNLMVAGLYRNNSAIHFMNIQLALTDNKFFHIWAHEETHLICKIIYGSSTPEPSEDFKKLYITMIQEKKASKISNAPKGYKFLWVSDNYPENYYAAELIARLFEFIAIDGRLPSVEDGIFSAQTIKTMHDLFSGVVERLDNLKIELLKQSKQRIKRIELYQLLLEGSEESINTFLKYIKPNNYKAYHLEPLIMAAEKFNLLLFKKCLDARFQVIEKDKFGTYVMDYLTPEFTQKAELR